MNSGLTAIRAARLSVASVTRSLAVTMVLTGTGTAPMYSPPRNRASTSGESAMHSSSRSSARTPAATSAPAARQASSSSSP